MASESEQVELFKDICLGCGSFGIVCKAKYDQLPCAAKLLHPTFLVPGNWAVDKFMQECSFLASLKHPHIVQFLGVHTDKSTGQAVLLMELMDESLTTFLKRYKSSNQLVPLHIQVDICHDIALAIHYLHTKCIIHRDLSSNNILLLGGSRAKITDFGMSKLTLNVSTSLSSLTQVPGCPVYMPPEAWISPPIYTEKLDIFSFGVLILQIATCRQPNPGPLETLIPDERSPTGFLKLPVPEAHRREDDLSLLESQYPLQELLMACLNDKQDGRPDARELCHNIENVKTTSKYIDSKHSHITINGDIVVPSTAMGLKSDSGYHEASKTLEEIQSLKTTLFHSETVVSELKAQILERDVQIESLKKNLEEQQHVNTDNTNSESPNKPTSILQSSIEKKTINNLSPEILSILKTDSNMSQNFNADYDRDSVTFYYHSRKEDNQRRIILFLQMYQQLFNTGEIRINFTPIPTSFPRDLLPKLVTVCKKEHNDCIFELLEDVDIIRILSKSSALNNISTQLVTDLLSLSITLPGGCRLILKRANVADQKVNVLVCAACPNLANNIGLAATFNAMSNFNMQKHCEQYIQKHGQLKPGQVMHIPATGSLQCNWIILAVGPGNSYADNTNIPAIKNEIESIMLIVTTAILDKADKLKAVSLAMPVLGCPDVEQKVSTQAVINAVLKHKSHYLKEIIIAVGEERFWTDTCEVLLENGAFWTRKDYETLNTKMNSSKSCKQQ